MCRWLKSSISSFIVVFSWCMFYETMCSDFKTQVSHLDQSTVVTIPTASKEDGDSTRMNTRSDHLIFESSSNAGTLGVGGTSFRVGDSVHLNLTNSTESITQWDGLYDDDDWNDDESDDDYEETTEGFFPKSVYIFLIYFILILGIFGNIMVSIMMNQASLCQSSYSVYVRFLAVIDTLVLLTSCAEDIMDQQFGGFGESFQESYLCSSWLFMGRIATAASPWFVVAFSIDRYIGVIFPFKKRILATRKIAFIVSCSLMGLLIVETAVLSALLHVNSVMVCTVDEGDFLMYQTIFRLVFVSMVPCVVLLYLNLHIIVGIRRSSKFRNEASEADKHKAQVDRKITISLVAVSLMAFLTLVPAALAEVSVHTGYNRRGKTYLLKHVSYKYDVMFLRKNLKYSYIIDVTIRQDKPYRGRDIITEMTSIKTQHLFTSLQTNGWSTVALFLFCQFL